MTARTWTTGDPIPDDHPALVDDGGVTWLWDPYDLCYEQQKVTHYPGPDGGPGVVIGSPIVDWEELLDEYGPVREATADEVSAFVEAWATHPFGGAS